MSAPPDLIHVVRQWVEKAEDDLITAEHTLKLEEHCPYGTICFHAQQCAEKYLKALLTFHAVPFLKIHDLTALMALVPKSIDLRLTLPEIAVLNRYAIDVRYPGDWGVITREDAESALAIARKVRSAVRGHLPKETCDRKQ
jgi:HEPN domain-containing protein